MAGTEMPNPLPVNAKVFDLMRIQNVSPVNGGFFQSIDRISPLWTAKYQTPPLTPVREQALQAFLDGLQGSIYTFLGFDPRRPKPYTYMSYAYGVKPWEQSSNSTTISAASNSASTITIGGLANGAVLTAGDYVSWFNASSNNIWYLHRITVGATAASNSATVTVQPAPINVSSGANFARLERACAEMKVVGGIQKTDKVEDIGPTYAWSAVQHISRS